MAFAESFDAGIPSTDKFEDARGVLMRLLLERHPLLAKMFDKSGKRTDLSKLIKLGILGKRSKPGSDEIHYSLTAAVTLHTESTEWGEEQIRDADGFSVGTYAMETGHIPEEWIFDALEDMDQELREEIAERVIAPERARYLNSGRQYELQNELDALNSEYHHILGDDL